MTEKELKLIAELRQPETQERAFMELVRTYQKMLYYHIRRMVVSHEDTDDILQNTFVLAWRNMDKFRGDSSLKTWLYRIATNETLTFIQKQKKQQQTSVEALHDNLQHAQQNRDLDGEEIQQRLDKAISLLPEKQKLVFNLRYFDELSFKEISNILNISEGGLKANYHHAAKKIEYFLLNAEWKEA